MSGESYWTARGTDIAKLWSEFASGKYLVEHVTTTELHMITFCFDSIGPLYNHEAIFKTIQYSFSACIDFLGGRRGNIDAVPLVLYDIDRGSAEYNFIGELTQLFLYGTTVTEQTILSMKIDNTNKILDLAERVGVDPNVILGQLSGKSDLTIGRKIRDAVDILDGNGLKEIKLSTRPLNVRRVDDTKNSRITLGKIDRFA